MSTTAIAGYGIALKRGNAASPEVFTTVAEVMKLEAPNLTLDLKEVTAHDGSGWKEFIATLKDGGEFSVEINYVPTGTTHKNASGGLLYDFANGTKSNYQIVFPDGSNTTWTVPAFVKSFKPSAAVGDQLTASVGFKTSGRPTLN